MNRQSGMSCAIAMRATKARAPKSTGLGGRSESRLTGGGGVSLRPDLSRHQQDRLRWRDPPLHRVDEATSDDWEPDDGSFRALIVVLALPRTQGASKSCQTRSSGRNRTARHADITRALKRHPGDPAGFPSRSPLSREVVVPAAHCRRRTIHPRRGGDLQSRPSMSPAPWRARPGRARSRQA